MRITIAYNVQHSYNKGEHNISVIIIIITISIIIIFIIIIYKTIIIIYCLSYITFVKGIGLSESSLTVYCTDTVSVGTPFFIFN